MPETKVQRFNRLLLLAEKIKYANSLGLISDEDCFVYITHLNDKTHQIIDDLLQEV